MTTPTPAELETVLRTSGAEALLDELDRDLVGLATVKRRVREIVTLALAERLRAQREPGSRARPLHFAFIGNPGNGKTTVAGRMAGILHRLGCTRTNRLVSVIRDDLAGPADGYGAARTRGMLEKARGGVLFVDEAHQLDRPERAAGDGGLAILLEVMAEEGGDLVVILAGPADRMEHFFRARPELRARIAHHLDFPDYDEQELVAIAELVLAEQGCRFSPEGRVAFQRYLGARMRQPHFANARSVRNALDRARLRRAVRLFKGRVTAATLEELQTIGPEEILASRVLAHRAEEEVA